MQMAVRYSGLVDRLAPLVAIFLLMSGPLKVCAAMRSYLPLEEKELRLRFPQHIIRSKFVQEMSVRVGTTTVRFLEPSNQIRFSGKDLAGKPWTVTADAERGGGLYSADLDHNGIVDLIYVSYTGGNGLAPPMHVLTLMFDAVGRPVPAEMDGYFEIDGHGLKDLVDLDSDGRAELIRQSYDDGYWIMSLYEARDAHWQLIHGEHAGRQYPLYTRFTNRPNKVPATPAAGRHPIEDDLANNPSDTATVKIEHLKWANVQQSGNPVLQLSDGRSCQEIGWYSTATVVLDSPDRRVAATLGAPEEAKQLLETIVRLGLPVQVAGNRRDRDGGSKRNSCSLEMIWAEGVSP